MNTYQGIKDEDGKRIFKKKLPSDREIILDTLKPYKDQIVGIVVESTAFNKPDITLPTNTILSSLLKVGGVS